MYGALCCLINIIADIFPALPHYLQFPLLCMHLHCSLPPQPIAAAQTLTCKKSPAALYAGLLQIYEKFITIRQTPCSEESHAF